MARTVSLPAPMRLWLLALIVLLGSTQLRASEGERPITRDYRAVFAPPSPEEQTRAEADTKSAGCITCHSASDASSMHKSPAVVLGCTDCHGGNARERLSDRSLAMDSPPYVAVMARAHVLPRYPKSWNWPSSANPQRSYTLLNRESPEFIRFTNPSDYRVARDSCGACHMRIIEASERSLMSSGAMLFGGASYNNGILRAKTYLLGEAYTRTGEPARIMSPGSPVGTVTPEQRARGALPFLQPLPTWHTIPPGDIFRVFERGGRNINTQFADVGLPNSTGSIQRLEEPGRPDLRQSNRGPGTGLRVSIPVLNIHKTRLNDPFLWFQGTNDQPGDYRNSGCAGCHVIYANDREPRHSLTYSRFGRDGQSATVDPTIRGRMQHAFTSHDAEDDTPSHATPDQPPTLESGHPIEHAFTRAIPTSQCMNCHMHQPNIFLNSFLGYTMWDYESDAPSMWPGPENRSVRPEGLSDADYQRLYRQQRYPTSSQIRATNERNPEAAAARGLWSDINFLRNVYDQNHELRDTQFADYHGHGWNFRAVLKRDREGNLLDAEGKIVSPDDPERWRRQGEGQFVDAGTNPGKTVHMMDIHAEKGMQCADCHFSQDSHGNGLIYGEVANAIEIGCKDCHGTADTYPTLLTSGPAAPPEGTNLALLRNPDGKRRFEWFYDGKGNRVLVQRSLVDPSREWRVSLVRDSVDRSHPNFNIKAARAKLTGAVDAAGRISWGPGVARENRAHGDDKIACFTCHLSWTTSCGGCHLPIEANWRTSSHKYDGIETRNFATYNPQVARDEMFQLGRHQSTKGNIIAPVRSTSALVLSSTNVNRERIYVQQPPISAAGFSSQAFAPHFPHTVRTTETKTCSDCHISAQEDNNAIMAQTLLLGTNFVNFVGLHAWTGLENGFEAVRVTEWDEPQAVIGSYLHRYAYPDFFKLHVERNNRELIEWTRGENFTDGINSETRHPELFRNVVQGTSDRVGCLQLRGEYMFVAEGSAGFRAYDVASIGNKGFSEPIVTAPVSPLGQNTRINSTNATCVALATNQPVSVARNDNIRRDYPQNEEQAFHPIYRYAVVTDSVEGLILVDIDTLADGEFRNNFFKRAVTWNPDGVLTGARHVTLAGHIAYITTKAGLAVVDLDKPTEPKLLANIPLNDARASAVQFRYLWVTDAEGLKLFDVTNLGNPVAVPSGTIPIADARRVYLARTYAYIAAKAEGLVIVNIKHPLAPEVYQRVTFDGKMNDVEDVVVATTNASLFAYVADGRNGLKVLQLTSPSSQPNFYGFSPAPKPELIAWTRTRTPALALSKGLDRDRAVDETGGQMAVFGRLGSRPFTRKEMERLFLTPAGTPYRVNDTPSFDGYVAARNAAR